MAIVPKLQSIINKANQTTGKQDKDLTAAVTSLVAGYGSGGGGLDTSDATAVAEEVPEGKTFYAKGKKVIGSCAFWQNNSYKPSDEMKILNFSSGRKLCLRATTTFNQFVPGQTLLGMSYPIENFGDATAADVTKGKTFTSTAGIKVLGTAVNSGGINTSDANATERDLLYNKTAYVNGKKIAGVLRDLADGATYHSESIESFSNDEIRLRTTQKPDYPDYIIWRPGSAIYVHEKLGNFGNATAADVAAGKTFTSAAGLRVTGTATAGGGSSSKNCEAYTITVANPTVHFKGTGTIKAWGYAEGQKVSYSTPKYAFHGDKYTDLSSFQATEKALSLSVDSSGKVTGLPAMTKGNVILTVGL